MTNLKPYDIPKRRVLVATRARTRVSGFFGAALEDGRRPPEVYLQKPASNHLDAAVSKRYGGERSRKRRH
jgi:hypothetical protein